MRVVCVTECFLSPQTGKGALHEALDPAIAATKPSLQAPLRFPPSPPSSYPTSSVSPTSDPGSLVPGALIGVKVH